ncbi:MAG: mercury(II) reductase [Bacteroidetes bacterium]|nr:MAG: mercury(II) reductase [Bacteroidota bacterium]
MTCEHCARGIERRFEGMKGIVSRRVSYPEGKGSFRYDPTLVSREDIVRTIEQGNYKVVGELGKEGGDVPRFDLVIIGGGSAAFSAAIRAEELGLSVLMVNGGLPTGGTCVNVGCVPSKHLIRAAETLHRAAHSPFPAIQPKGAELDFRKLIEGKRALVEELRQKKYLDVVRDFQGLTMVEGWAEFEDEKTILVNGTDRYRGLKFLIATGARTNVPQIEGLEGVGYLTNATLFEQEELPESMTILGAGYIGLEIAMAYRRFGTRVRLIEFTDRVLRSQTPDISEELERHLRSEGIEVLPNFRAQRFERRNGVVHITCRRPDGSTTTLEEPGAVVVATGIRANTRRLGLDKIGVQLDERGHIRVNDRMQTSLPHVFAAGDVADTPAYVYTAAYEGRLAVENAFTDSDRRADYSALPWVVFTDPQVAGVGLDEAQAEAQDLPFEVTRLPLKEVPRALAANDTRGFIKLIRNPETDRLLGARIVAPEGGELVMELSLAIRYGIPVKELAEGFHPYLTLSEGIKLAAITFGKDVSKLSCCAS